jgi:hypothetical protein
LYWPGEDVAAGGVFMEYDAEAEPDADEAKLGLATIETTCAEA